jgi:hypothetical protein
VAILAQNACLKTSALLKRTMPHTDQSLLAYDA